MGKDKAFDLYRFVAIDDMSTGDDVIAGDISKKTGSDTGVDGEPTGGLPELGEEWF